MQIKRVLAILLIGLILFTTASCTSSKPIVNTTPEQPPQSVSPTPEDTGTIEETPAPLSFEPELFLQIYGVQGFLHGIVFDGEGNMYIGKDGLTVLKITPDKSVFTFATYNGDMEPRTYIWNMTMGPDGDIYAAAAGRIIRINMEGEMETVLTDDFSGHYGMLDIKFDPQGNMYVVKDQTVIKYTPDLKKSIFIDETDNEMGFKDGTGICFDSEYKKLYITDPGTHSVYIYPIDENGATGEPEAVKEAYPHYIDRDADGNTYCSMETPGFFRLDSDGKIDVLSRTVQFATLKFGNSAFGEDYIYATEVTKIYRVKVGSQTAGG